MPEPDKTDLFTNLPVLQHMLSIQDHTGKLVNISTPPSRIISLVPSLTELLYDFGLDEKVIGITKFCVHPHNWFNTKTRVGGTKNLNIELIKPCVILGFLFFRFSCRQCRIISP